jgi:hypothetical protein
VNKERKIRTRVDKKFQKKLGVDKELKLFLWANKEFALDFSFLRNIK